MKRWPELHVTKPRSLSNYRANTISESVVHDDLQRLDHVLTKFDLKHKPQCLYNVDEKGIQTENSKPYLLSADSSTPGITSSRSATATILGCGNALGTMIRYSHRQWMVQCYNLPSVPKYTFSEPFTDSW